ncbi:sensor domain-containing diguanylate cyclase [Marinospirillum alkaliphilum]|uniref:diguanylate cyclase n=1 Tax=Marinospirillum alkaliphilum DSM 21637 TaxID=1122209 RepID=A0A1K1XY68_9GAMM|nr:diguanylate cyclase [Marinospirillum alkaliphilum]SFX54267.1 diguanylate cyclase (GGDEF) domain-containing protein [Marinospirillum alkaliphilum DSM 21637]
MTEKINDQSLYTGHFVQFLAAGFLSVVVLVAAFFNWQALHKDFTYQLETRADELKAGADLAFASQRQQLQALASLVVLDPELQRSVLQAWETWQQEGENPAGPLTLKMRQQLQLQLEPLWGELQHSLGVDQLQLHFPDSRQRLHAYLRMHAPDAFGDELTDIRPMIVAVLNSGKPTSGFEIGRHATAVRGAASLPLPSSGYAVLELGTGFTQLLLQLDERFSSGFALLLHRQQLSHLQVPNQLPEAGCDLFISASSRTNLQPLRSLLQDCNAIEAGWTLKSIDGINQLLVSTRFEHPSAPDHSALGFIWQDVDHLYQALKKSQWQLLKITLFVWLLIQLSLLLILHIASRSLRQRLLLARDALKDSHTRLTALTEHFQAAVLLESSQRKVLQVNRLFCQEFSPHCTPEQINNKSTQLLLQQVAQHFSDPEAFLDKVTGLQLQHREVTHEEFARKDGRTLELDYVPIHQDGQFFGHLWVFRDVTLYKQQQEALSHLARTDSLTNLPNRRYFMERLHEELHRCRRLKEPASVIMFDIDHFKRVNDTWGHAVGDEVLQELAQRTQDSLRVTDLAGRLGGEEFALLLPGSDEQGAQVFAERLRRSIADEPFNTAAGPLGITISLGISRLLPSDPIPDEPLQRADVALYQAKAAGRNCFRVAEE